jgi:uncharacterized protein
MPKTLTRPERPLSPVAPGTEVRIVGNLTDIEVRELRADGDGEETIGFTGHAALFDNRIKIGGKWGWYEEIAQGAFDSALEREDDVRLLKNHNPDLILARTTTGRLRLSVDDIGLVVDADMTPTTVAKDLAMSLSYGDITQMSFGFRVLSDEWSTLNAGTDDEAELRRILDVELWDVSPVTFPAYPDTDAALRAHEMDLICRSLGIDPGERHQLLDALGRTEPNPDLSAQLRAAATRLTETADSLTSHASEQGADTRDASGSAPTSVLRLRHQLRASQLGLSA